MRIDERAAGGSAASAAGVRAGVGTSDLADSTEAGRSAATAALGRLAEAPAGEGRSESSDAPAEAVGLVMVYSSVRYDLAALLAGIRAVTGDVPLVGATTAGQFHNGGVTAPGEGVAVLAMTAGPYRFGTASVTGLRVDAEQAGRDLARAAQQAAGGAGPHSAMLMLADGLAGDLQDLLNGVHKVAGAVVPVVGGSAGDDRQLTGTSVFHDDQVVADGAAAVWIDSPWPLAVVAEHGWTPISMPLLVTRVEGPVIQEIAGRPATEVFEEFFHDTKLSERTPKGWRSAQAFGLIEPDGSMLVRGAYVDGEGQLRSFCPLPTYAPVEIVQSEPDEMLGIVETVANRAAAGREPSVLLAFSCLSRLDVLGERVNEEATRLQTAAGSAATFGFYTYGEIARTTSVAGYHNGTLAAIAL